MTTLLSTAERQALFLLALKEYTGNVSAACKSISIGRSTIYHWLEDDESFAEEYKRVELDLTEELLDSAEDVIKLHIMARDKQVAEWLLTKKGKSRGYGSKVDVNLTGDAFRDLAYPDEVADPDAWDAQTDQSETNPSEISEN